ncbi:MAG: hypothetical protein VCD50_11970 [Alphaproteobacteria bacterium]
MATHESVLVYRGFRYLKLASLAAVIAVIAYAVHSPLGMPNGGTWLGYTLGIVGALLILWLMYFGIRKRTYASGTGKLEDWLSAHIYLGVALIIIATLHTGFQFGLNIHTLAYTLMMFVIISGMYGLYAYIRFPRQMTDNQRGVTLENLMQQIAELSQECTDLSMTLSDEINGIVVESGRQTSVGGGFIRQLSGRDPNCTTIAALARLQTIATTLQDDHAVQARRLISRLSRKVELLYRARKDVQLRALMKIFLFVHVPMSFALFAALFSHVFIVFFYW